MAPSWASSSRFSDLCWRRPGSPRGRSPTWRPSPDGRGSSSRSSSSGALSPRRCCATGSASAVFSILNVAGGISFGYLSFFLLAAIASWATVGAARLAGMPCGIPGHCVRLVRGGRAFRAGLAPPGKLASRDPDHHSPPQPAAVLEGQDDRPRERHPPRKLPGNGVFPKDRLPPPGTGRRVRPRRRRHVRRREDRRGAGRPALEGIHRPVRRLLLRREPRRLRRPGFLL